MKKLLLFLFLFPIMSWGQKIKEDTKDKFTGQHLVSTSQEALIKRNKWKNQWQQVLISLRNIDGNWTMPTFFELNDVEKYDENSQLLLLLNNGKTIILNTLYTGIGNEDCPIGIGGVNTNVHGFSTVFNLSNEDIDKLRNNYITDVRVSPLGHNYDFVVDKKEQELLKRMISLIDNKIAN